MKPDMKDAFLENTVALLIDFLLSFMPKHMLRVAIPFGFDFFFLIHLLIPIYRQRREKEQNVLALSDDLPLSIYLFRVYVLNILHL